MMNIAWTFTAAIVIFAAQRYAPGVEPMCSSPYSPTTEKRCSRKLGAKREGPGPLLVDSRFLPDPDA
jgi:hypothetical protein